MEYRTKYEQDKMKITQEVSNIMDLAIAPIFKELDKESVDFINKLYNGRRNRAQKGGRLRDIMVLTVLNACGIDKLNESHLKVIASGEFYNIASYFQNWHLDNKKEVKTNADAKLCHIASHLFREIAERLILETDFSENIKLNLLNEISESNQAINIGQSLELNVVTLSNLNGLENKEDMVDKYLRRCYLFSGRFYGCSFAMGAIMANADEKTVQLFKQIGENFGTGGQIINDAGDFCLNKDIAKNPEKDYQDQFADLIKGTVTLPIFELSNVIDLTKYSGRKISNEEKEFLLDLMIKNRCFDRSRKESNKRRNMMIKLISNLPSSLHRSRLNFIIKTFFNSNKFYVNLRDEHGYSWRDIK